MPEKIECRRPSGWKSKRRIIGGIALAIVASGASFAIPMMHMNRAWAESMASGGDRVFELRVYHVLPGRMPALEARFRDTTSKLLAKHGLKVLGFWIAQDAVAADDRFIFLVAHHNRSEAKKNWDAMRADPAFQGIVRLEQADKTVNKVDSAYMDPADFSPIK
jgi:hypothetical protein